MPTDIGQVDAIGIADKDLDHVTTAIDEDPDLATDICRHPGEVSCQLRGQNLMRCDAAMVGALKGPLLAGFEALCVTGDFLDTRFSLCESAAALRLLVRIAQGSGIGNGIGVSSKIPDKGIMEEPMPPRRHPKQDNQRDRDSRPMRLTIAVIMDPMEKVQIAADTSFAFMLAAQAQGHRILHVSPARVSLEHHRVMLNCTEIEVADKQGEHFKVLGRRQVEASECAAIFIRTDPPFDEDYLRLSWILSFAEQRGVRIINSPRGLREANEHLYSLYFPELCPKTLISSIPKEIRAFVDSLGGEAIAKPIDGHAGFGVVKLRLDDSNFNALIDMLSHEGKEPIMVQRFIPEAKHGDRRIILLDGEPKGVVVRVPAPGDHRGNVHVGGKAIPAEIDDDDRRICAAMAPRLKQDGLYFVGIDVIDGQLIEVNVTSPTLVREIKELGGPDIAAEVIASVEKSAS